MEVSMRALCCLLAFGLMCSNLTAAHAQDEKQPTTKPVRGWLGCKLKPNEDAAGIVVAEVIAKSPADAAGIKEEDVITKLDGKSIEDIQAFVTRMRQTKPGDQLKFTVMRDKSEKEITVTLGDVPKELAGGGEKETPKDKD